MFSNITNALGIDASKTCTQIQNTIANMDQMPDGHDIRSYSSSAHVGLLSAGTVNMVKKNGEDFIATIAENSLDDDAVSKLVKWVNTIISASDACLEVELTHASKDNEAIATIHIRPAAQCLGMEQYVDHLVTQYKSHINVRIPTLKEDDIIERFSNQDQDDILEALAARLEYLRRTGRSNADKYECEKFLKENQKIAEVVDENERIAYSNYCFSCRWNEKNPLCRLQ
ncbi:hypothetical protein COCC4DRAFT_20036 [Bipolaris maydis ATCC 48331]|uniref:Uncharacterized protein n=2 Tax=Cochliobolus heterostrophus TaxID=5016 RepID=M2URC5_COCH5|nr:uncharacterized protein COCC4DRAFT_20036 [Bipolaris maydis ATCC 48331]EMD90452.1 hypothetical protein COCHEDRAFT_1215441 [Bipolaris maydis C5]KAH7555412.1 hypothetical protein BM1_07035 [Bipolaris maydis]ENI09335.1 hypothetical protein COCC4DRAFT_20036 [Bipolaris maydis ATCC 48331]KAJ5023724.1 hypothetical protein J3E73DRAFT_259918 [Bipolaris maydis]KAJ5058335.1 hypothetical protein J3E74DRAFT_292383 [Bipolaris maydis]